VSESASTNTNTNETINIHDVPTADQVRAVRTACKMTQAEFGMLIGAHEQSVSKYERGVSIPREIVTRIQRVRASVSEERIEYVRALLAPNDLYAWAVLVTGRRMFTVRVPMSTGPVIAS
jgi:DNA-binding transcriptional regulator YiaG